MVRMLNPNNIHLAYGLARMQGENLLMNTRANKLAATTGFQLQNTNSQPESNGIKPKMTVKKISLQHMKERKEKGLCYYCDFKWNLQHKCNSIKLFMLEGDETNSDLNDDEEVAAVHLSEEAQLEVVEELGISLHAITGFNSPKTMWLRGRVNNQECVALIDSGSTHNFLDPRIMRRA